MSALAAVAPAGKRGETMWAAVRDRWGSPEKVVELRRVPKPTIADDQVLVRVVATSINRGDYYSTASPGLLLRPLVGGLLRPKSDAIGGDFAGVVEAVGKELTDFAPGDAVFGARTGAFAEYVAAKMIAKKPANVSFEEAAAVPVGALTALQGLRDKGKLQPGQSVLINGASGAVGTFAVQIAKALGAGKVTAVCRTRNVEQARELGADRVIDYTQEDFVETGERYDVVLDIAGTRPWRQLRRVLQPNGTLVMVGSQRVNRLVGPMGYISRTSIAARLRGGSAKFFIAKFNRPDLDLLGELLETGQIKPTIERVYPFGRIAEAITYMGEGHARGKLVVTL